MPIYAYRCLGCGNLFEAFRSISSDDREVECPKCGRKHPHRELTSFISKTSSGTPGNLTFPT